MDLNAIEQFAGAAAFGAGNELARDGWVSQLREAMSGSVVTGVVSDAGEEARVYIHWHGGDIEAECSCGATKACAHVVAVMIQARHRAQSTAPGHYPRYVGPEDRDIIYGATT